ncbi:odorant receptor 13a-like isoform X2 [Vespula squamosa]
MTNSSMEYKLPYKIKPLLKPHDAKSSAFGCLHQFFGITLVLSGYCRVKELLKNTDDSHGRIRQMILRHYSLIR